MIKLYMANHWLTSKCHKAVLPAFITEHHTMLGLRKMIKLRKNIIECSQMLTTKPVKKSKLVIKSSIHQIKYSQMSLHLQLLAKNNYCKRT